MADSKRVMFGALMMVLLIAAFYLLREHWEHIFGLWPYIILLLCPLMHLFHAHGRPDQHHDADRKIQ
jgi:hypothetical protein